MAGTWRKLSGDGIHKVVSGVSSGIDAHAMTLDGFIKHVFPDSAVRPMVDNEILQIVIFSIFFGVACASMGARARLAVLTRYDVKRLVSDIDALYRSLLA